MEESKEVYYSLYDIEKMVKNFLRFLLKRWWLLFLIIIIGSLLGLLYYYYQKPKFRAFTTFILEDKSSGGGSGLAGLASQFGFSLGSLGSSGSIFGGDNILNILKSKKIVQYVLLTHVDTTVSENESLADLYLEFSGLKKRWQNKPNLSKVNFNNSSTLTRIQDSVMNVVYERIVKDNLTAERASKQGTIIRVQITTPNADFSRLMAERLVHEASKLYMNIRIGNLEANIKELQRRSDSLLILLNRKSFIAAASQPLDINPGVRTAIVPVEIATRDKTVLATLYAEVTKNLEASKMLLSQETPVIEVLDVPGLALKDYRRGKVMSCIIGLFAGLLFALLLLGFLFFRRSYSEIH